VEPAVTADSTGPRHSGLVIPALSFLALLFLAECQPCPMT
jgi:hypothetical protein